MFSKLSKMTIREKMKYISRLFIINFIIVIAAAIYTNYWSDNSLHKFSDEYLVSAGLLLQVDRDLYQAAIAERSMILSQYGSAEYSKWNDFYNENLSQAEERWNKYAEIEKSEKEESRAADFLPYLEKWKENSKSIINMIATDTSEGKQFVANRVLSEDQYFTEMRKVIDDLTIILEEEIIPEAQSEANLNFMITIGIIVVLFIGVLLFSIKIADYQVKTIAEPIVELEKAAKKIAANEKNVVVKVENTDEIGDLAKSFNIMSANIEKSMNEISEKNIAAEEANKSLVEYKNYLDSSVEELLDAMNKFSAGDLEVNLEIRKNDEIGKLFDGFNKSVANIKSIIISVREAIEATAAAAAEISSSTEQMASGSHEQSTKTLEVAGAVEEMTKTIQETATNASGASDASRQSKKQAILGVDTVNLSKTGMQEIVSSSVKTAEVIASLTNKTDQIGNIAQVIDEIADQTNLLALNAAIEAARAGEQGRGFAVVADEVRKLAERTTKATKEIAETIKAVQMESREADKSMEEAKKIINHGMGLNEKVESVLNEILKSAEAVSGQIEQVAAASEEQSTAASQISSSIETINSVTTESAASISEVARTADDLSRMTENLQNLISNFKINMKRAVAKSGFELQNRRF